MPKNSLLPTNNQFRTDFPEFANTTRYPDPSVDFYLSQADALLNQDVQGNQFVYLAELFTAHYVELRGRWLARLVGPLTAGAVVSLHPSQSTRSASATTTRAPSTLTPDSGTKPHTARSSSGGGRCTALAGGNCYERRDGKDR